MLPQYLSPKELSKRLSVGVDVLAQWRWLKKGPPFIRIGIGRRKLVRYSDLDVSEWLKTHSPE